MRGAAAAVLQDVGAWAEAVAAGRDPAAARARVLDVVLRARQRGQGPRARRSSSAPPCPSTRCGSARARPTRTSAAWEPSEDIAVRRVRRAASGTACWARTGPWTSDRRGGSRARRSFDVCGDLPTGMTLLQASAGTGKTFTIAALTTRYVAEGILPIDRLLVITFTRMATGELRERVRERLVRAFDGLVDVARWRRRTRGRRVRAAPGRRRRKRRSQHAATGWARPSPTSTRPPSRRPTDSACRSSMGSGPPGTWTARSRWSRT